MKRLIWKFELGPGKTKLQLPPGAEVLCVGTQPNTREMKTMREADENVFLWVMFDASKQYDDTVTRTFYAYATGEEFELGNGERYIGTIHIRSTVMGPLVFHVFEW